MDKEIDAQNQRVVETVITIRLDETVENRDSGIGGNEVKGKVLKKESFSSVIDVKYVDDFEKVCRICHLDTYESGKKFVDLIEIGCGCKGELGFVHSHCAETWFKLKGNR